MKRPKTNSKKISWFSIASVFLLAVALAGGASTNAQAATGSFDRDKYLPALSSTNDYDRAFVSVTDSSVTTATTDTITISVKAGTNAIDFILRETGGTTTVFTTTGLTQPGQIGVGTTSGYAPDFRGSHLYPALGVSTQSDTPGVTAVNLKGFVTQNGGNATDGTSGNLTVASGNTLELLYGGSTLDTAIVGFSGDNNSSITFTKGSAWGESVTGPADAAGVADNVIITLNEPDENLNPKMKDCIGFQDGFRAGFTGTGSSRVQIEAINQSTGVVLSVGGTPVVARHIMLTETGNSTGIFTAVGKVYGTTNAGILRGNIFIAGTSNASFMGDGTALSDGSFPYTGGFITLGSTTTNAHDGSGSGTSTDFGAVGFKILEITASGRIGLIFAGTHTGGAGTATLAYQASTGAFTAATSAFGTSSWSSTRVVAVGTNSTAYGAPGTSGNTGSGTAGLLKLIDGNNYCLVQIGTYTAQRGYTAVNGTVAANLAIGGTFEGSGNGLRAGSITVTIGSFIVTGPRNGDTVKVSYLDTLTSVGTLGTVTSSTAFGTTGETGTLAADKTSVDINDFLTITVVDGNLNASSSSQTSIAFGNWDGTTTNSRGDRLTVAGYTQSSRAIDLSHADGSRVGTQSIRISNSDNSLVWIVPTSQIDATGVTGFRNPLTPGSSTFTLGTETTSALPAIALTRGAAADATSFLSGASTGSFAATADAVNGTVEISPDGTHWVAVPITETGINSSTFVGTVGFDFSAARVTIDTTTANSTSIFADQTGTSSIIFVAPMTAAFLERTMGTGSVVRISDGLFSEFQEVTGVAGLTLSVKKMTNTSLLTPWKTFVQVVGNDMSQDREDTVSGSTLFRIGGYFGATYRIRYNDAVNSSGSYAGGATLAVTTANVGFTTSTGALSTAPSGTTGVNSMIVVTLVDNDLNTGGATAQATFTDTTTLPVNLNEVGVGIPSGTSTGNSGAGSSALAKKNGGAAKVIFASNKSSVTSSNITDASTSNSAHFALTETAANSGTFKGSFQLSSANATSQTTTPPRLQVTSGDVVTVFYNDSPSASVENNLKSLTAASFVVQAGIGTLSLSKAEAFLSGDSVVVTVNDSDINTSTTTSESTQAFVTTSSGAGSITVALAESTASSGLFVGTFRTGATTDTTTTPRTIRAVAGGTVTVTYQDASPAQDVTALVSTKNFGAALNITSDSVALDGNAIVSLRDEETNTSIATANIASLNIKSTTDSTGVAVIVTETGVATGSFLGTIKVSTGSSLSNTNIKAAVGDTLTVTFTDNPDASGLSSVVTDTALVTSAAATPTPTPTATPTPTPTPTPAPGTGSITGTVVNAALATPIAGATVSTDTGGFTATTAADGTYTISNVTPGTYTLTASATGFASSSQSVAVTAGVTTTANFSLTATATPTPTATPTATATPTPTATATPTPTATATPVPCEPEKISADPAKSLTLSLEDEGEVTVTVSGDDCLAAGVKVEAKTTTAGLKRISISPASDTTDASGEVVFTITAKDKKGNARITFKAEGVKKALKYTVKVKK